LEKLCALEGGAQLAICTIIEVCSISCAESAFGEGFGEKDSSLVLGLEQARFGSKSMRTSTEHDLSGRHNFIA
jgi:hypothetical protein